MSGIDGVLLSIDVQLAAGCGHVWLSAEHAQAVLDLVEHRSRYRRAQRGVDPDDVDETVQLRRVER